MFVFGDELPAGSGEFRSTELDAPAVTVLYREPVVIAIVGRGDSHMLTKTFHSYQHAIISAV